MKKTRQIFIYLAIIAVILGIIGIVVIEKNLSGKVVSGQKVYNLENVQKHNSGEDCWVFSGNKVYDITLFLQTYDDAILRQGCGEGVSLSIFDENVQKILEEYEIGFLE
jgi:hypothetical protein